MSRSGGVFISFGNNALLPDRLFPLINTSLLIQGFGSDSLNSVLYVTGLHLHVMFILFSFFSLQSIFLHHLEQFSDVFTYLMQHVASCFLCCLKSFLVSTHSCGRRFNNCFNLICRASSQAAGFLGICYAIQKSNSIRPYEIQHPVTKLVERKANYHNYSVGRVGFRYTMCICNIFTIL